MYGWNSDIEFSMVSSKKNYKLKVSIFTANKILEFMYSSEDLERFYLQYQSGTSFHGELSSPFV